MHKNVALLDVAHTLLFDNSLNASSLEALKENRGSDTYLFTETTYLFSFLAFSYLFFRFSSIRSSFLFRTHYVLKETFGIKILAKLSTI
ncbi:hypothetical protein CAB17_17045 [Legionella sainthelensi]|uniref:Uncharacterized protein n=1 Tax=Legionella sainthelensi TaxID=28087 RepID=A0A2H5FPZ5_9GAMM|nr:hypothetical protein CAB17_17045 [Legionella sainthelensi]